MAKLRMGILDGFQGRVGPVVGYRLGSKWIMRRLPQQVCNPRTERQVAHRMMFRDIVRLASALLPALKVGYRAQANQRGCRADGGFHKGEHGGRQA